MTGPIERLRAWLGSIGGDPSGTDAGPSTTSFACSVCGTVVDDPDTACPLCGSAEVGPKVDVAAHAGDDAATRVDRTTAPSAGGDDRNG